MKEPTLLGPRKRPSQPRSQATFDAILEATARVLVDEGYDRANTNRIAEVAGVSIGSLYQYFPSKEALVATLVEAHAESMLELVGRHAVDLVDVPVEEAVRSFVVALLEAHRVNPQLERVFIEQLPRIEGLQRVRQVNAKARNLVHAYLVAHRDEVRPTDLALAAQMLVVAVGSITNAVVFEDSSKLEDGSLADEMVELVLRYLLGSPRT